MDASFVFTLLGVIVSGGATYGVIKSKIDKHEIEIQKLQNDIKEQSVMNQKIISVETKIDFIINHMSSFNNK